MTNKQERETSIAAITIALVLFFGAISLAVSYVAVRTGLLAADLGAIESFLASATTD